MKKFGNLVLTDDRLLGKEELSTYKGGDWCYSYTCTCGYDTFFGEGDLDTFRSDASNACSSGDPVDCIFSNGPSCAGLQ